MTLPGVNYMLKSGVSIVFSQGRWGKSSAALRVISWLQRSEVIMMPIMGFWMLEENKGCAMCTPRAGTGRSRKVGVGICLS